MTIRTRTLANVSAATTALFPTIVVALNVVQHRHYDPITQAISELALGSAGTAMVIAFGGLAIGIAALAVVIRTQSHRARVVPIILGVAAVLAGPMSAGFHTDRTGAPTTWHGTIHNDAGLGAFLLLLAAMVISSFAFARDPFWKNHLITTRVLTVAGVISFFLIPGLGQNHFGISQRLFVGSFVTWLILTALYASRKTTTLTSAASSDAGSGPRETEHSTHDDANPSAIVGPTGGL